MRLHRTLLLVICLGSMSARAGDDPLSLDEAVTRALEIAPQVSAQVASVDAMRALAVSSGRLPDPELVVGVDNLPVNGPDAYSFTSDFMTMQKIGVMQQFPRAAKRKLQRERADADASVASAGLVEARLAIAREVAQA